MMMMNPSPVLWRDCGLWIKRERFQIEKSIRVICEIYGFLLGGFGVSAVNFMKHQILPCG